MLHTTPWKRFFLADHIVFSAIALNAVVLFLMAFPQLSGLRWLTLIDHIFILYFCIELYLKLDLMKPKQFWAVGWNRFDAVLVAISVPALFLDHMPLAPDTSIILVFRLFRLVRLLRFLRFVPNLDMLLAGLGRALKASVFVFVVLFLLNFLLALITCQLFGQRAPEYFGDPLSSLYTMFQIFTVEGWNAVPDAVTQASDNPFSVSLIRLYFVLVVIIGGIFGMSIANAIFVDEMVLDNNRELEDKIDQLGAQIEELKTLLRQGRQAGEDSGA